MGDTFYVSGYGLPRNRRLVIMMSCPAWYDPHAAQYHNIAFNQNGPRTNARGEFVRFKMQALKLHHDLSSGCLINEGDGSNPFGPDIPALYTILRPDQSLRRCDKQICGKVTAVPRHARAGYTEHLSISGWPGASAMVTIQYPAIGTKHYGTELDPRGNGALAVPVPSGMDRPGRARIHVSFHLGKAGGGATTQFTIVH